VEVLCSIQLFGEGEGRRKREFCAGGKFFLKVDVKSDTYIHCTCLELDDIKGIWERRDGINRASEAIEVLLNARKLQRAIGK
jgi:hypothetical protein